MATLHVEAVFNPEEAAHAAAEFVSSMLLALASCYLSTLKALGYRSLCLKWPQSLCVVW
jgi:hypothetical protein